MSNQHTSATSNNVSPAKSGAPKTYNKKKSKKVRKILIIVIAAIIILLLVFAKSGLFAGIFSGKTDNNANTLSLYSVSTRTITKTLTSSGTIQPNDSYTITALVSGEILDDHFEEGDTVEENQLLYEIDSSNLDSTVKRSRNSLKNAQTSLDEAKEKLEKLTVTSKYIGTVQKLYVEIGDDVNAGSIIADVVDKSTMCIDSPFMATDAANINVGDIASLTFDSFETLSGIVTEISPTTGVSPLGVVTRNITVNVRNSGGITPQTSAYVSVGDATCTSSAYFYYNDEGQIKAETSGEVEKIYFDEGQIINKNQTLLTLSSTQLENQIESLELSLDNAQSSLDDALDAYDDYNITSPISGTVISKDYKSGDTLGHSSQGGASMAVIYDMSAFKFIMSIDELDIDSLSVGQEVLVTSDAREGKQYHGKITNISIQGTTSSGTTVYPVTVTIENSEDESLRQIDENGTIHKTYKTGKTSVTDSYNLISAETSENCTAYKYSDDIIITVTTDEQGNASYLDANKKQLRLLSDGRFTTGNSFYTFSDDMSVLSLEITDESKMLKPGMNIDADIVVQKSENVVSVPVSAVMRGYVVKVVKRAEENSTESDSPAEKTEFDNAEPQINMQSNDNIAPKPGKNKSNKTIDEMTPGDYGSTNPETSYEEVRVEIGINDDEFVEITNGLNVGDIIILDEINAAGIGNTQANTPMGGMPGFGGMGGMSGPPSGGGMGGMGHPSAIRF